MTVNAYKCKLWINVNIDFWVQEGGDIKRIFEKHTVTCGGIAFTKSND